MNHKVLLKRLQKTKILKQRKNMLVNHSSTKPFSSPPLPWSSKPLFNCCSSSHYFCQTQFSASAPIAREQMREPASALVRGAVPGTCLQATVRHTQPVRLRARASTPQQCLPCCRQQLYVSTVSTSTQPGVNGLPREAWSHSLTMTSGLVRAEEETRRRAKTKLLFSLWKFSSLKVLHRTPLRRHPSGKQQQALQSAGPVRQSASPACVEGPPATPRKGPVGIWIQLLSSPSQTTLRDKQH